MISSACPRASRRRSRYSARTSSASLRMCSAWSIESSIAFWRRSSACAIRGNASFHRTNIEMPKRSSVQIISPTLGVIRNEPLEAAVVAIELLQDPGEQACDQAVEEHSLGQRESEPLDARDLIAHLRLAGN